MTKQGDRIPLSPFEQCSEAFKVALELYDQLMRQKTVVENLERFDVAKVLALASNHFLEGRLCLQEALRRAGRAREDL